MVVLLHNYVFHFNGIKPEAAQICQTFSSAMPRNPQKADFGKNAPFPLFTEPEKPNFEPKSTPG